jgi:flagellar hook-associated protein 3 FlgL
MPLRVTQTMLNTQLLTNLNNNMQRMDTLQNQLSTGKRINKPSDDPVGISFSMRYRSELSANDQYQSNINASQSWMDYTDTTLNQAGNVMQRIRELAVQASNGTNDQTGLSSVKAEVKQMYDQLVSIGNSEFNGKYVFNGQITDVKPYDSATASSNAADKGEINFDIGAGVRIAANISGSRVFGDPVDPNDPHASDNMFNILQEMMTALDPPPVAPTTPTPAVPLAPGAVAPTAAPTLTQIIGKIDSRTNKFLDIRSELGAKTNRVELADSRMKDIGLNLQSLQTKTEDADMSIVITNLKMNENVYQASLSAGSKVIQPSLIDFLK